VKENQDLKCKSKKNLFIVKDAYLKQGVPVLESGVESPVLDLLRKLTKKRSGRAKNRTEAIRRMGQRKGYRALRGPCYRHCREKKFSGPSGGKGGRNLRGCPERRKRKRSQTWGAQDEPPTWKKKERSRRGLGNDKKATKRIEGQNFSRKKTNINATWGEGRKKDLANEHAKLRECRYRYHQRKNMGEKEILTKVSTGVNRNWGGKGRAQNEKNQGENLLPFSHRRKKSPAEFLRTCSVEMEEDRS